jgi:hypothetical protein
MCTGNPAPLEPFLLVVFGAKNPLFQQPWLFRMSVGVPHFFDRVPKITEAADHLVVCAVDQSYIFPATSKGDRLLNLLKRNSVLEEFRCELFVCGCEIAIESQQWTGRP